MASLMKYGLLAATLIAISATFGCGGSSNGGGSFGSANIRVLVLNPTAGNVSVSVDGRMVNSNLAYLGDTGYVPIKAGGGQLTIVTPNPTAVAGVDTVVNLAADSHTTFLLDGWAHFEQSSFMLTDDNTPAPNSAAKLRILNASLGSIKDFYLLPAGSMPGGTPLASGMAFNNATNYQVLAPGSYEVFATLVFTPTQIFFDSGPITLAAGQNRTLVLLSNCQPNVCSMDNMISITLADLN
ncbi:MAG TPA: DUF4397 domain-containing protein [Candidatus Angelobacter sp.]